jgi:hypothetical protein
VMRRLHQRLQGRRNCAGWHAPPWKPAGAGVLLCMALWAMPASPATAQARVLPASGDDQRVTQADGSAYSQIFTEEKRPS